MEERIVFLIEELNKATKAYDEGKPIISDKEWDDMFFELVDLEAKTKIIYPDSPTQKISYEVKNNLTKVTHNHPMLSLAKTKDINEIESFVGYEDYVAMEKLDGLSCSLEYVGGKLVAAETRGDGSIGEDVLHNVRLIKNVPKYISFKNELIVDGEIFCPTDVFEEKFSEEYKNPRNYAAGALRRLDAKENKDFGLSFLVWDVIKGFEDIPLLSSKLEKVRDLGFNSVDYIRSEPVEDSIDIIKEMAKFSHYPIDGAVFKYNNVEYYDSLGATDHHFRGGLAFKFYDESYSTKLKYIDWGISRNGILTPVAVFEPVKIDGSVVERASLHNLSVMQDIMGDFCYEGQGLQVIKSNMIIPQIVSAEQLIERQDKINLGDIHNIKCPCCGGDTKVIESESGTKILVCDNSSCQGKLQNIIDHFCSKKGLDIKGLSLSTIDKLITWGWLNNIIDIFSLKNYRSDWIQKDGFGEKSVDNILTAIEECKNNCELWRFISSLGIPLIGVTIAKEICKYYSSWTDFRDAIGGGWSELEGFGPEMEKALNNFDYSEADKIAEMLIFKQPQDSSKSDINLEGLTFCVTGKLVTYKNRDELKSYIESLGGKVVGSMSSKVNYLINNDINSTSTKNTSAKKLNIPIITEQGFIDAFGQKC